MSKNQESQRVLSTGRAGSKGAREDKGEGLLPCPCGKMPVLCYWPETNNVSGYKCNCIANPQKKMHESCGTHGESFRTKV